MIPCRSRHRTVRQPLHTAGRVPGTPHPAPRRLAASCIPAAQGLSRVPWQAIRLRRLALHAQQLHLQHKQRGGSAGQPPLRLLPASPQAQGAKESTASPSEERCCACCRSSCCRCTIAARSNSSVPPGLLTSKIRVAPPAGGAKARVRKASVHWAGQPILTCCSTAGNCSSLRPCSTTHHTSAGRKQRTRDEAASAAVA